MIFLAGFQKSEALGEFWMGEMLLRNRKPLRDSLVAQRVKRLPAMLETRV